MIFIQFGVNFQTFPNFDHGLSLLVAALMRTFENFEMFGSAFTLSMSVQSSTNTSYRKEVLCK